MEITLDFVRLLISQKLLSPGPFFCNRCGRLMNICKSVNAQNGAAWKCTNNACRRSMTIKTNSLFNNCGFNLKTIYVIYACWAANFRPIDIGQVIGINDLHGVNCLLPLFRAEAIKKYQADLAINPLGTVETVQMDETALGKAKYHKGRALKRDCNWAVGIFEEKTNRVAVENVSNRNTATLTGFVQKNAAPGAEIYSDQWPAYNVLTGLGYTHKTVNHSIQFINVLPTGERVYTEKAESNWGSMKKFLDQENTLIRIYKPEHTGKN